MIDYGLVFIASLSLRTLLSYRTGDVTLGLVFALSFIVTLMQLSFKIADTSYDMLLALLFPLFKFFPFIVSIRDAKLSAEEFKMHLINDPASNTNQGK